MNSCDVLRCLSETSAIEGWLFPIDALVIGAIDEMQRSLRIAGHLFEIGVHHGKSAILLARMLRDAEWLGVCDVFEQQHLNVDRSGEGSRELFTRNLATFAATAVQHVRIFAKRSDALLAGDTTTTCRLFHIDGGHRPENVFADMATASRALLSDGVVVVDDVFNPSWPGVGEGVYDFMRRNPNALAPMIIGGNKVTFVRPTALAHYRASLDALASGAFFQHNAFVFEQKEWLGTSVLTASRRDWVDLHPMEAARLHLPQ